MSDSIQQQQTAITKLFPYFIMWHDLGSHQCEGHEHCRSLDEAAALATTRIIFGDVKESVATVYSGDFWGKAKQLRRYYWSGKDVVFQDIKR